MESYYSSDEEMAWGPLTLPEITRELKKKPRKLARRESDSGQYTFHSCDGSQSSEKGGQSNTSTYYTPNSSSGEGKTKSDFLEKLEKVINEESAEQQSSYASASETMNPEIDSNDTMQKILNTEKPCENLENIQHSLVDNTIYLSSDDEFSAVIVISDEEEVDVPRVDDLIKEERRTISFLKPPVEVPIDDLSASEDDNSIVSGSSRSYTSSEQAKQDSEENESESTSTEFIEEIYSVVSDHSADFNKSEGELSLSCDEDEEQTDHDGDEDGDDLEPQPTEEQQIEQLTESNSSLVEPDANEADDEQTENGSDNINEQITEDTSDTSAKCDKKDDELSSDCDENGDDLKPQPTEEKQIEQLTESNICLLSVPSISLDEDNKDYEACRSMSSEKICNGSYCPLPPGGESFTTTDSETKDESLAFNDTLEEMEMALKRGLDYVMPGDEQPGSPSQIESPCSFVPPTPSTITKPLQKSQKRKFDYVQSPIGDYIRKSPKQDNFKLPLKPMKSKQTPSKRSPLVQTKHFKNIVSPIGVYIKNSPGVCLKQNVPVKTIPKLIRLPSSPAPKTNKENSGIPQVIYKPAKTVIEATKRDIILPPSIQKLVQEPVVTEHEKRIKQTEEDSITEKLLEEDLTTVSVDPSLLNPTTVDVSFRTNKQAFIK